MDGLTRVRPRHDADVTPPTFERIRDRQHANDTADIYLWASINALLTDWDKNGVPRNPFFAPRSINDANMFRFG